MSQEKLSFENSEIAFKHKSNFELKLSYLVFKIMSKPGLVKVLTRLTLISLALRLPIKPFIKMTIFKQFCGGESIAECSKTVAILGQSKIGAILDYSVEGEESEEGFESTAKELLKVIETAKNNKNIPVACIKITGIGRFKILNKLSQQETLSKEETAEAEKIEHRLFKICEATVAAKVPLYIDAEESWIQPEIDRLAEKMMANFNKGKAFIFTTVQMYRWDRLPYLTTLIDSAKNNYIPGVKIVRGAYLEKENKRAKLMGYTSPIQTSKEQTDSDYNKALKLSIDHINELEICAGTHNEKSAMYLAELMSKNELTSNNANIYFSQLYGMSDHISYNLSELNYNVTKYLPYGPVKSAMPYLIRRAEENTAISGQSTKELNLITREKKRRKLA